MRTFHPFLVEPEISERKSPWSKFDKMPLDEKRELYRCGKDFVTLDSILPWSEYLRENVHTIFRKKRGAVQRSPSLTLRQLYSFLHVNASLVSHCHCMLSLSTSDRLCSLRVSYIIMKCEKAMCFVGLRSFRSTFFSFQEQRVRVCYSKFWFGAK